MNPFEDFTSKTKPIILFSSFDPFFSPRQQSPDP
jgi:hypothetical protein